MSEAVSIGLGFLEGLGLIASPCILPILPIVLSAGLSGSRQRPYGIVLGFMLTFSGLTLFSRWLVQALHLDPTLLRQIAFVVLLIMGLLLLFDRLSENFYRMTAGLSNWGNRLQRDIQGSNEALTGILIGACIGGVWVPCSGPVLAAVLVQAIQQKTTLSSVATLLAFSLGAALPMLAIIIGGQTVMKQVDFLKHHGPLVRKGLGVLIILTVILTSQDVWPQLSLSSQRYSPTAAAATPSKPARPELVHGLDKPYPAPPLTGLGQWINSKPLSLSELKGKVVLVDFWTYSCINCIRTLPHLKAWDTKYRNKGLVILGVHAPEFEFERNLANVQQAVKKFDIHYPVALDSNLSTWSAFNNQYWPAHYLIDQGGQVVYTHFGEGEYDRTESNIQRLLGISGQTGKSEQVPVGFGQTPETYLGLARAERFRGQEPLTLNQIKNYHSSSTGLPQHYWGLEGNWKVLPEQIVAEQPDASLSMHFSAKKVFLVLGSSNKTSIPIQVYLNGKTYGKPWIVSTHRLYTLLSLPSVQQGIVTLKALKPGLQAYAYTFES